MSLAKTRNAETFAIWGTGSLCERFFDVVDDLTPNLVSYFIDNSQKSTYLDKPVLRPEQLASSSVSHIIICSSFLADILPQCLEAGIKVENIRVVLPRTLDLVPLTEFSKLTDGSYYHLPWHQLGDVIRQSLSADIVFPDVYKELAKAVGYAFIASVEGDFAEFGTCTGYTASLIAHAVNFYSEHLTRHEQQHGMSPRRLHLFDSFQGFPKSTLKEDQESPHVASGAWGEGTAKGLSAEQLKNLCASFLPSSRLTIYAGWYKDTLVTIPSETRFAFVHLDCDLYESTIDVLRHLLDQRLLSDGAVLMFDNWFCNKASRHFGEQKAWHDVCGEFKIEYTNVGMYACVGNKIIIHNYERKSTPK